MDAFFFLVLSRHQKRTPHLPPALHLLRQRQGLKASSVPRLQSCCRTTWQQYITLLFSVLLCLSSYLHLIYFLNTLILSPLLSCGQSCRLRRSSSLPLCSTSTETVPPFMSSALICGSSMETAGNSSYSVQLMHFLK